ncbi:MAG TPA: TonB-dependent receptor [Elusimicrobiota bacterium]|nr:TonB-dependent receptor [Elusimicrobiota bacterium]
MDDGQISPYGSIDPTQGGKTERHNLSAAYTNELDSQQKARGVEMGARGQAIDNRLTSSLVIWAMDLDSELTFDPDTGGTEASGPSRRAGIESEWGYQILPWLHSDLDINFAQAKYRGSGGAVPYAIDQYISGGLTAFSATGWQGAMRFRDVGNRWGDDARMVPLQAYCVFDALVGYRRGRWGIQVAVDNLINTSWRDGQEALHLDCRAKACPWRTYSLPQAILGRF